MNKFIKVCNELVINTKKLYYMSFSSEEEKITKVTIYHKNKQFTYNVHQPINDLIDRINIDNFFVRIENFLINKNYILQFYGEPDYIEIEFENYTLKIPLNAPEVIHLNISRILLGDDQLEEGKD